MIDPRHTSFHELRELMDPDFVNSNKINCIKTLRQITGEGLKDTKDFFEQEWLLFINGDRKPRVPVQQSMNELDILRRLNHLEDQVATLTKIMTKERAKGIFNG